ncbi:hypothetical protein K2173_015583 [Erythroxylum novogranatense]|uniref:RecQ mediated genome instability protein 1 OB-fold domain-containing protein n=1 Tax=Erythroxylum novogranatense TaxID=1862640 RepID=A0AAV8SE72_9ROSI|nr:hypothetical protein K2173_015583 [Erythroxylum novogranatense]
MEAEGSKGEAPTTAVVETLRARGWFLGDINQVNALIFLHWALSNDDGNTVALADSVESELLNMELKSIGSKSLPDPVLLRKTSHLQGPIILQVSAVKDISVSSMEGFSDSNNKRRLLKLSLTDGHSEITAIEYSHLPSIPSDIVPGSKVRLENKVPIHSGILCLKPKAITLIGGVVQTLYQEWQMNQKCSGLSRSSVMLSLENGSGGPPPFEKLQIGTSSKQKKLSDFTGSTAAGPAAKIEFRPVDKHEKADGIGDKTKTDSHAECAKEQPSTSEARPREVAEAAPVQNQAAAQKLLQKMTQPNQGGQQYRGRKHRGKDKLEEHQYLTLVEWENAKAGAKAHIEDELADTIWDEDLAWQLQNDLDIEDSHIHRAVQSTAADDIRMSMFSYERDTENFDGRADRWRGRGRGSGRGRGRGSRRGRGRGRGR